MNWLTARILAADAKVETNILPSSAASIGGILELVLNILVYGIGVAAVIGVVVAGIMYLTARDSEAQVAAAKKRLYEVVLGLILWVAMWSLLQWLIPGFKGIKDLLK